MARDDTDRLLSEINDLLQPGEPDADWTVSKDAMRWAPASEGITDHPATAPRIPTYDHELMVRELAGQVEALLPRVPAAAIEWLLGPELAAEVFRHVTENRIRRARNTLPLPPPAHWRGWREQIEAMAARQAAAQIAAQVYQPPPGRGVFIVTVT